MAQEAKATLLLDHTMTLQVQPITAAEEHQVVVHMAVDHMVAAAAAVVVVEVDHLEVVVEEDNKHLSFLK